MPAADSTRHVVLFAVYAVVAGALAATVVLPRETLERHAWAFFHFAALSPVERLTFFGAMLLTVHFLTPSRFRRIVGGLAPARRLSRRVVSFGAAVIFLAIFWIFRDTNFDLGDSALLIRVLTRDVHLQGYHITLDEPLELYLHSIVYAGLHRTAGWDVARSYALVSAIAGALAVPVLIAFCSHLSSRLRHRLIAFALFTTSGFFALFFGHVENYTVVLLGLVVYLLVSILALRGRLGLFWPALTLSTALCFHGLAAFFLPSLVWLWWERSRDAQPRSKARDAIIGAAGLALPIAATLILCASTGVGLEQFRNTHAAALKFIALLEREYEHFQYSFLSPAHIVAVVNQLTLTALPGILAIAAALWEYVRLRPDTPLLDPHGRFLVVVAVCGQFLALTWHPDLGPYRDWDLFAVVGLGDASLGAYLLARMDAAGSAASPADQSVVVRAGVPIVLACGFLTCAWIGYNATRHVPVEDHHEEVHTRMADVSRESPIVSRE